jgi:hypothetical protein
MHHKLMHIYFIQLLRNGRIDYIEHYLMDALIKRGTNSWLHYINRTLIHGRIDQMVHEFKDSLMKGALIRGRID